MKHEQRPLSIILDRSFMEVNISVELDGEIFAGAIKIEDVVSNAVLTAKLTAVQL